LIAQALANLVDNAIKYTPEGGKVTLSLSKNGGHPTFAVADTGPGVPDAYKEKVLQRLFRLEQSRTSPGSGLGLSLVHAVSRSHGLQLKLADNHPGLCVALTFEQAVPVPASEPKYAPEAESDPQPVAAE
jgi:signal transduction histidine kinase